MSGNLELSFEYRFEAAHRFVSGKTRCTTPHGHTWYVRLILSGMSRDLHDSAMLGEFSGLKRPWKTFVDETLDHSFFHHYLDPVVLSMREHIPGFRGLAFPDEPTTEMIAGLLLCKAKQMYLGASVNPVAIELQETPTNSVRFLESGLHDFTERLRLHAAGRWDSSQKNWWSESDPLSRSFHPSSNVSPLTTR